jgi:hypothetical protein
MRNNNNNNHNKYIHTWGRGGAVVKALRYKPEGRGFDLLMLTT